MGISYSAKVMVGLPRGAIKNQQLIEDELTVCPPYYDDNSEDYAIAGLTYVSSGPFSTKEFTWDQAKIDELKVEFKKLTGQEAKVWLSPNGS